MQPLAPKRTVCAGSSARSMIAWHASTSTSLRAIAAVVGSRPHASVSVAFVAAITSGLPLYVPRWSTLPAVIRSISSCLPPNAPTGKPPPIDLASVTRSGSMPKCPVAPP